MAQILGRERAGPLEYSRKLWLRLWLAATFVFLYAPIAILILFSFNDSRRNIVWQGFTLDYYAKAWGNASLIEAFANSLVIAPDLDRAQHRDRRAPGARRCGAFAFPASPCSRAPWRCRS